MATARTICTDAASQLGIIGQNEALAAVDAQRLLRLLNNMVSSWRTQFGTVISVNREVFPLVAHQQTYTIGIGGDFNLTRPIAIEGAALLLNGLDAAVTVTSITRSGYTATVTQTAHGYAVGDSTLIAGADDLAYNGTQTVTTVPTANTFTYTVDGTPPTPATGTITAAPFTSQPLEIPRQVITDDAYQAIQFKTLSNAQFTLVYYNPTYPLGTVFLWPMPNTASNQLVLYLQSTFTGFADLTTEYDWPSVPGYGEALEYNLAVRAAAPFGRKLEDYPMVVQIARDALGTIKRANNELVDLPTDASLLAENLRAGYNIQTGTGGY